MKTLKKKIRGKKCKNKNKKNIKKVVKLII